MSKLFRLTEAGTLHEVADTATERARLSRTMAIPVAFPWTDADFARVAAAENAQLATGTRLFRPTQDGLLQEIPPEEAAALLKQLPMKRGQMVIDVQLTDAELAELQRQEVEAAKKAAEEVERAKAAESAKTAALTKLQTLGLTADDLRALLG